MCNVDSHFVALKEEKVIPVYYLPSGGRIMAETANNTKSTQFLFGKPRQLVPLQVLKTAIVKWTHLLQGVYMTTCEQLH